MGESRGHSRAGFGSRWGAGCVDWILILVIAFGLLFVVSNVGWFVAFGIALVAYFVLGWHTGGTIGMRTLSLRLVDHRSGGAPKLWQTIGRALVAFATFASAVIVFTFGFSDRPERGYSSGELALTLVAAAVVIVALVGNLLALGNSRRSLQDRLFRLEVVLK